MNMLSKLWIPAKLWLASSVVQLINMAVVPDVTGYLSSVCVCVLVSGCSLDSQDCQCQWCPAFFLLKIMSRWVPHRRAHVLRMARVSCFLFLATFLHPSALLRYGLMMDFEAGFQSLFTEHPLQLPVGQHAANEQAALEHGIATSA